MYTDKDIILLGDFNNVSKSYQPNKFVVVKVELATSLNDYIINQIVVDYNLKPHAVLEDLWSGSTHS